MAKVIGQDTKIAKQATCKKCGAIVEYYFADVKKQIVRDYGGGSDTEYTCTCPACSNHIIACRIVEKHL